MVDGHGAIPLSRIATGRSRDHDDGQGRTFRRVGEVAIRRVHLQEIRTNGLSVIEGQFERNLVGNLALRTLVLDLEVHFVVRPTDTTRKVVGYEYPLRPSILYQRTFDLCTICGGVLGLRSSSSSRSTELNNPTSASNFALRHAWDARSSTIASSSSKSHLATIRTSKARESSNPRAAEARRKEDDVSFQYSELPTAQGKSTSGLFAQGTLYEVPGFQRGYSWEEEDVDKLLKDFSAAYTTRPSEPSCWVRRSSVLPLTPTDSASSTDNNA